jgi:hypothetical protein
VFGILISPAEGSSGFVILADVADQLGGEIRDGSKDSPRDDISLDFGKPDFDLIEPARIGRSVMDPNRVKANLQILDVLAAATSPNGLLLLVRWHVKLRYDL